MLALSVLSLASLALSPVSALVVPRKSAPEGWATGYLEEYDTYHERYLALSCHTQHNTEFFDQCCHPLLATENLQDNREAWCTPSPSASSSAADSAPTTAPDDDEDSGEVDCEEDDEDEEPQQDEEPQEPEPTSEDTPAPEPTTEDTPAPEPTTTEQAPPTETSQPSGGNDSDVHTGGFATFYYQNGVAGACGDVNSDDTPIAAVSFDRYGNLGAKSDLCGKHVKVTNPQNGKSVEVVIADACEACAWESLDLSSGAFNSIAEESQGMVDITWTFV